MSVLRALSWVPTFREWFTVDFTEEAAYSEGFQALSRRGWASEEQQAGLRIRGLKLEAV